MANVKKNAEKSITLKPIDIKTARVFIEGDGDLVLNKMNARNQRTLMAEDRKSVSERPNRWEDIITSVHWLNGVPASNTYTECDENMMLDLLKNNKPCVTAFGLKKSFEQAVVRNEIDTYATKFANAVNIVMPKGLVPVTFAEWSTDEKLMSPKRGKPINVILNHFSGWKADFLLQYTDSVYGLESIINIINLAGFGLGIGSGRSSGYGRYHVVGVEG